MQPSLNSDIDTQLVGLWASTLLYLIVGRGERGEESNKMRHRENYQDFLGWGEEEGVFLGHSLIIIK